MQEMREEEMKHTPSEYADRIRIRFYHVFGERCFMCGCQKELQFAHMRQTGVSGRGRGKYTRAKDIRDNFGSYELLCRYCHSLYDAGERVIECPDSVYGSILLPK